MKKEVRTIVYDDELQVEAYILEGIVQPFPKHFHDHYVFGFMEGGERSMCCQNRKYLLGKNDLVLFHPEENHECSHVGELGLDYRAFNIPMDTMRMLSKEIMGIDVLPRFRYTVFQDEELSCYLHTLHEMVMKGNTTFEKEELLLLIMTRLLKAYSQSFDSKTHECSYEVEKACVYIQEHGKEHIGLDDICHVAGLSKSTLLRAFTAAKGITPYRYLEAIRINDAKKLLEQGYSLMDAALMSGFSDQSHFTNHFTSYTGVTPASYREIFQEKENK